MTGHVRQIPNIRQIIGEKDSGSVYILDLKSLNHNLNHNTETTSYAAITSQPEERNNVFDVPALSAWHVFKPYRF